ncbi:serine/threonine-protein kinase VRK1-like isoform X2 [Pollicipes pollicipes]|uniref:serine/threonine-protein kinase VRK1-like isoform X2 n=1 Tax=Pollicipes pollicipes TaxID=41117 RepID=UPI0018852E88|nr:serine/threonine-protein kinase VRK1-like isoform X2 [Pollicipes pollicipes]
MAPRRSRAAAAPQRATNGHRVPVRLPPGLTLIDVTQRRWRLGRSIGIGGFGEIYCADRDDGGPVGADAAHVVKVEPHSNGPLFSEMHCYHRVARADMIDAWRRQQGLKRLGMPRFVASGSVEYGGQRYRFMVMERYGTDLQKLLDRNGNRFPMSTIFHIGLQVIDVLEYVHSQEYIHGDVKAQNLLLGMDEGDQHQVYLVDFGMASRYANDGRHKPNVRDARKAHNGTIEFTSRDAHIGAHSRRGDLEILGYNLLQWACGRLPWQDHLRQANAVARSKCEAMADVSTLVRTCFPLGLVPGAEAIQRYLELVAAMPFDATPDYDGLRAALRSGLHALGSPPARLRFSPGEESDAPARGRARSANRRNRSPLQPVQDSSPLPHSRRRAAPKQRARGRPVDVTSGQSSEDEQQPAASVDNYATDVRARAAAGKGGRRLPSAATKRRQASAAVKSRNANGVGYDNLTPSMRAVLDQRAQKKHTKLPRGRGRGVQAAVGAASSRPEDSDEPDTATAAMAQGRAARAAARQARLSSSETGVATAAHSPPPADCDEQMFYTPPSAPARRRSGRLRVSRSPELW